MDREKVIKGMEMCISPDECSPNDCPYYERPNNESGLCWDRLMTDALALLKEQEKALYELGQLLKERAEEIERLKTPTAGDNHIPLRW